MKLWLDDERPEPVGWVRVTTAENCIEILTHYDVDELSLDHDLDDVQYRESGPATGYDVAYWLWKQVQVGAWSLVPGIIKCHSANPVGRERIVSVLQEIRKLREEASGTPELVVCPNHDAILAYARKRGLASARIESGGPFGWRLHGDEREIREDKTSGLPLIWTIVRECGISYGGGSLNSCQIKPEGFKEPTIDEQKM